MNALGTAASLAYEGIRRAQADTFAAVDAIARDPFATAPDALLSLYRARAAHLANVQAARAFEQSAKDLLDIVA